MKRTILLAGVLGLSAACASAFAATPESTLYFRNNTNHKLTITYQECLYHNADSWLCTEWGGIQTLVMNKTDQLQNTIDLSAQVSKSRIYQDWIKLDSVRSSDGATLNADQLHPISVDLDPSTYPAVAFTQTKSDQPLGWHWVNPQAPV
jgi:hypothetical protein